MEHMTLLRFCRLKNLRHLDLRMSKAKVDVAATEEAALRLHLSSLPLQSLRLPLFHDLLEMSNDFDFEQPLEQERYHRLLSMFTQLPNSHVPSPLASWSASLASFRCAVRLLAGDPMLTALTAQPWPLLRKLQLTPLSGSVTSAEQLHRSLLPSSMAMPALTWLELGLCCNGHGSNEVCTCARWWTKMLHGLSTITTLKLKFPYYSLLGDLLELLHLVSADTMPQLIQLHLIGRTFLPLADDDCVAAIALLQHMPLTQLIHINAFDADDNGFELLHHLPHLIACTLDNVCCPESVAAAPSLEDLTCDGSDVLDIADRWWRRCGNPPLQHVGFVDGQEWRDWQQYFAIRANHSANSETAMAASPLPAIRALHWARCSGHASSERMRFPFPGAFATFARARMHLATERPSRARLAAAAGEADAVAGESTRGQCAVERRRCALSG
jgi:hypothetical protein